MGLPITPLIKSGPRAYLFLLFQASMFASSTHNSPQHPQVAGSSPSSNLVHWGCQLRAFGVMPENQKGEEPHTAFEGRNGLLLPL